MSKTDVTRYLRCPYAFHLLDSGRISFEDTVNKQQARLIAEGIAFQRNVEAAADAVSIAPDDLPKFCAEKSVRLFNVPLINNNELMLTGKPDAVDTSFGALYPVEIKSHKSVQSSDELELAFYWRLLERLRTKTVPPRGYLLLRRNRVVEQVEIELRPHRFKQLDELLAAIRTARQSGGVRPRICGCTVCAGVMREEINRVTRDKKDLTLIWDIGRARAKHLEANGFHTYEQLIATDPYAIIHTLRECSCHVSVTAVEQWKHHASSYSTGKPVAFGQPLRLKRSFIALDLEYISGMAIWLVGVCIVKSGKSEYWALWADSEREEKRNLKQLAALSEANPNLPVVTWSGASADLPHLKHAAQRLRLGSALDELQARHLDLFQYVKNSMRFPIPFLGLSELATYFGIARNSRIRGGLEAQSRYLEYRTCSQIGLKAGLKKDLVEYNRDDLEALVGVATRIAALGSGARSKETLNRRKRRD